MDSIILAKDLESRTHNTKYIVAQMRPEDMVPGMEEVPYVIKSTHPRYRRGRRFDYGFIANAVKDGYAVAILPQDFDISTLMR